MAGIHNTSAGHDGDIYEAQSAGGSRQCDLFKVNGDHARSRDSGWGTSDYRAQAGLHSMWQRGIS